MGKPIIGEIIEAEVRRQGLNMGEFADSIFCSRQNVYNIFKRNTIDIVQLQLISKVLHRNFFQELALDPELAGSNNPEIEKGLKNRWAVAQFFEMMPIVFKRLNIQTCIVKAVIENEFNDPLPDFGLSDYAVYFTVGETLKERFKEDRLQCFEVQTEYDAIGQPIDVWHNLITHSWFADVKLDFKTEEEWGNIILYLINQPYTKVHLNDSNYDRNI
jgi:hypothetical protein